MTTLRSSAYTATHSRLHLRRSPPQLDQHFWDRQHELRTDGARHLNQVPFPPYNPQGMGHANEMAHRRDTTQASSAVRGDARQDTSANSSRANTNNSSNRSERRDRRDQGDSRGTRPQGNNRDRPADRCSTPNRPIGGLRQHSEWRDSMTKATAPVASTAQGSQTQRLTGSMAPVHRCALGTQTWGKTREDAITDQTSDHGNCRMTRRMTSPRHEELTRPAKSAQQTDPTHRMRHTRREVTE